MSLNYDFVIGGALGHGDARADPLPREGEPMTDPERDLAAKVRAEFDALPDVLMVGPPELDASFARFGAALDSLLALTVERGRLLTEARWIIGRTFTGHVTAAERRMLMREIDAALAHTDEGSPE